MDKDGADVESGRGPSKVPYWKLILDQGVVTPEVVKWEYDGAGTEEDPYIVTWIDNDFRNPQQFSKGKKWFYTFTMAFAVLAVSLCSSAFSGGIRQIIIEFGVSQEVVTLGLSLFVLGFALGPLFFAPMSELYGRQIIFVTTYGLLTVFLAGCAGAQNIQTLLILRFFAGTFGSSPLTNAGGVIADMFNAAERGLATSLFAVAPFLGPVIGPIIGGFLGEAEGWRWVQGFLAIFAGSLWIFASLVVPETYPPVLLRKRAQTLSKMTGKVYRSKTDIDQGKVSVLEAYTTALSRPWILLFREPIVLILSIYVAIVYGTLYMLFGAYPVVYQEGRGWSEGIGGLAFIPVAIGMVIAVSYSIFFDNPMYIKKAKAGGGFAPPEARLPVAMIGGIALPIALFWFAWTNSPKIHWLASMAAGVPFGFGMVLVFLGIMNYLIDAYTIFAASVLAANSVLRSCFGAAFPLFTSQMYSNLGIHWASTIPAFLALACVPFPFLFYKYGASIRAKCKFAAQSEAFMKSIRQRQQKKSEPELEEEQKEHPPEAVEQHSDDEVKSGGEYSEEPKFERIRTNQTRRSRTGSTAQDEYYDNPYVLDRVNTRESFKRTRSNSLGRRSISRQ